VPDLGAALDVGGVRRTYTVHVPEGPHAAPWPMLVVLHGRNLTGPGLQLFTYFSAIADRKGFAAVYPDGYERTWNDGRGNTAAGLAEVVS
jgi:polyhydroxybutyrate depolymerase